MGKNKKAEQKGLNYLVNERIRARRIRLIDDQNENCGEVPTEYGLKLAREKSLDLVEVSPNANPPVCRIIDFGKFKYQIQKKHADQNKNKQKMKEVKLRAVTEEHDLEIKRKRITDFLEKRFQVRIIMEFRHREIQFKAKGLEILKQFIETLPKHRVVSKLAFEGKKYSILIGAE